MSKIKEEIIPCIYSSGDDLCIKGCLLYSQCWKEPEYSDYPEPENRELKGIDSNYWLERLSKTP